MWLYNKCSWYCSKNKNSKYSKKNNNKCNSNNNNHNITCRGLLLAIYTAVKLMK